MGSIQHGEATAPLSAFVEVCRAASVYDWRRYCTEGLYELFAFRLTDEGWRNRYFEALTHGGDFQFEHRLPSEVETGGAKGNCGFTTFVQDDIENCQIRVPELEIIRIGIEPRDEEVWLNRFCKKYNLNGMRKSPFARAGAMLELRIDESSEEHILFAAWIHEQLYGAIGKHLAWTVLYGQKEFVDQFDGFFELVENGNTALSEECAYPLSMPIIDFGFLVTGIPGAVVNPASRVPDNHPPVTLHPGTILETTFPVAGKDLVDILTSWKRFVPSDLVPPGAWALVLGKDQDECVTRLAGCKMQCVEGGCGAVFMNPSAEVVQRAADFINGRYITLWPDTERISLSTPSPALGQRNWILFAPRVVRDGENGEIDTWSIVMQNMQRAQGELASAWGLPVDERYEYGLGTMRPVGFQKFDPDHMAVLEAVPDVTWEVAPVYASNSPFCLGLAAGAKATMIMECPEWQLLIKGVACDIQPTMRCPDEAEFSPVDLGAAVANGTANVGFLSEITFTVEPMLPIRVGDEVFYRTAYGTTFPGVVTASNAATGVIELNFLEAGVTVTVAGGPDSIGYIPNFNQVYTRHIKTCAAGGAGVFTLTFDNGTPFLGAVAGRVLVTSALQSTAHYGAITTITSALATDTELVVTLAGGPPADCDWDVPTTGSAIGLDEGGTITIRLA